MHRVYRTLAPTKWGMTSDNYAWQGLRVKVAPIELFDDDLTGVFLIINANFIFSQGTRAGYIPIKIIGVRRPQCRNIHACLRPNSTMTRMRVHNTGNTFKRFI